MARFLATCIAALAVCSPVAASASFTLRGGASSSKVEDDLTGLVNGGGCPLWCYKSPCEWSSGDFSNEGSMKSYDLQLRAAQKAGTLPSWKPECLQSEGERNSWGEWFRKKGNEQAGIHNYTFWYTLFFGGLVLIVLLTLFCGLKKCCCGRKKSRYNTGYYYDDDY